jgi:hypothetical protein
MLFVVLILALLCALVATDADSADRPERSKIDVMGAPPIADQICEYAVGVRNRFVICETVSAY